MFEKKIVIVNQDSGYLMIDIANAYAKSSYDVSLITGRLITRNNALDQTIKVHRIISYNRSSRIKRIGTWIIAFVQILFLIRLKYRNHFLFLVSNPPFTSLIPMFVKNKFDLLIFDIYPDALVQYKILKEESYFIRKWEKWNRTIFEHSNFVFTLNEKMKDRLIKYVSKDKIKVIPIWTDNSFLRPLEKQRNPFLKKHNLEDKFVIIYSGNLGRTHPLERLVEVAYLLQKDPFYFLIIGGGEKHDSLEKEIKRLELKNIKLMPWQSTRDLPITLAAADIGVVTLGKEASDISIPSKTYNLMSVSVPILSISSKDSALSRLVLENKIGENFEEDEVIKMANFIEQLEQDKPRIKTFSQNSFILSKKYTPENAFKFIS